jgi:prevent-host-death family protein
MRSLPLADAKARLSEVIDEVEGGGEVVITRRGRPVARLVPERPASRRSRSSAWLDELREFVEGQPTAPAQSVIEMRAGERY